MESRIIIDDKAVEDRIREKAESRKNDFERLARGEVTAEELQRENSIFPEGWVENVVIENFFDTVGN